MVEYTLVLEIGQSNASPVGDIQGWEDKHPELAIRSPNTARSQVKQFSTGSYRDDFTLAATFKGGPQVGDTGVVYGAAINGTWQTVNLRGVAVDAVRVATFYNPIGTLQTTGGYARSWPGTYNVVPTANALTPNTAREFATNFIVQQGREHRVATSISGDTITSTGSATFAVNDIVVFSADFAALGLANRGPFKVTAVAGADFDIQTWPEGAAVDLTVTGQTVSVWKVNNTAVPFLITRKRTGSTHTYAPTGLGNTGGSRLVVDPPFVPAQSDDEEFTVDMRLQKDAGSASSPLSFDAFFGGQVEGKYELVAATERFAKSSGKLVLHSVERPLRAGRAIQSTNQNSNLPGGGTTSICTTGGVSLVGYPGADNYWALGDAVIPVTGGPGSTPAEITIGQTYYVVSVSGSALGIAATLGGTPISFAGTGETFLLTFAAGALVRWPTRQPTVEVPSLLTASQAVNNFLSVIVAVEFTQGEKIRVSYPSSSAPAGLPAGDYLVSAVAFAAGAEVLTLTELGGAATTYTWGGEQPVVERLDAYTMWFVSDVRGGDEIDRTTPEVASRTVQWQTTARFNGSISGLRLRCVSGANLGQWKHGTHVTFDVTPFLSQVHFDGSWASTPERNDVFVLEPTPVGDQERPFEKFCQLLPWSPFEGKARGARSSGTVAVTISSGSTTEIVSTGLNAPLKTSVQFFTTGELPNGLIPGKTYYSAKAAGNAIFIAETYGGPSLLQTSAAGSGTHYAQTVDNDNGFNPHPPGFNYPSQFGTPRRYMPFDGYVVGSFYGEETSQQSAGVTAGLQLSFDLYNYTGRRTLFVPLAFGGTSISHREVHPTGTASTFGWLDENQQISWAPGEENGCFARLEDTLDGVKLALTEEGSTIKDVVVHFNQGEADAMAEYTASTYRQNLNRLKQSVRQALYDRGLAPVKAARIKWLHATIKETLTAWPYAATVNAAIDAEAAADPYSRALVGTDLEVHAERDTFAGNSDADGFHYHGAEMDTLGKRAFTAYKALERSGYTETEVCNMALSYLGEPGRLTNVDTDTTREAELCRQFLPLARDELIERHPWDFALRSVRPTKRSASPRVDYKYAYDYPEGVASVLGLVRSDVDYNYKTMGTTGQYEYTVELDDNGDRVLLTDLDDALMLYVAKVTDPTKWSTTFTSALAWRLVFHMAGAVIKGEEGSKKAVAAAGMAERALRTATKHDGDTKRDVDISNHVPTFLRHRSNPGSYRR